MKKSPKVPRTYSRDAAKFVTRKLFKSFATKDKLARREWVTYQYYYRLSFKFVNRHDKFQMPCNVSYMRRAVSEKFPRLYWEVVEFAVSAPAQFMGNTLT